MVLSSNTKRPRNGCKGCGYSWYPKGRNKSVKCPRCNNIKVILHPGAYGVGVVTIIIGFVAVLLFVFIKR
jgi:hypothetical protein